MTEQVNVGLDPLARIDVIDILRGIALFRVVVVNIVTEFRVSLFTQFLGEGVSSS